MQNLPRLFVNVVVALLLFGIDSFGAQIRRKAMSFQPQFEAPLQNQTVVEGREASFTCIVSHLGGYRVAWIKADSKAILAIHNRVITHSKRMRVVHSDHNTWTLHIKNVQQNDSGQYMCQINTDPMKMQVGVLEVVVPPDIILEETSGDIMVTEGSTARLVCRARGVPPPTITWKREDGQPIVLRSQGQPKKEVNTWDGAELTLEKISRGEMGAYFCIASNGHPPSVSKRIVVNVHFHPIVHVPNQLLGSPQESNISLECMVEASPKSINYWTQVFKNQSSMIVENQKYKTEENVTNAYSVTLKLTIVSLESKDFGEYACTAKNSIGEVEGTIKVYEIMPATPKTTLPPIMQVNRVMIPDGNQDYPDYNYVDHAYDPDGKDRHSYRNAGQTGKKAGHHIPTSVTSTTSPQILRPHHSFPAPFPPSAGEAGSGAGSPLLGVVALYVVCLLASWGLLSFVGSWR